MKIIYHSILGSGQSAVIRDQISSMAVIFCKNKNNIKRSKNFFEFDNIGGNTNIWGGYLNLKRHKFLIKDRKYFNFFKNTKLFYVKNLINDKQFESTSYLSNYNSTDVFRINKKNFKNKILSYNIDKIVILKKNINLFSGKKIFKTKKLSICTGNLGLIEILYNSNLIGKNDIIGFEDGKVNYSLNLFKNKNKNYYIPMSIYEVFIKLFFNKVIKYKINTKRYFLLQKFSKQSKKFNFTVNDILQYQTKNIRYFLSHHITNLKINGISIDKFMLKVSNRISVYNSGKCKKYYGGPISQDIIFNSLEK